MKKRFQTGGNIHAVPASRQNAEPRTPSGVRPVSSPVTPVQSDVQGVMKHGGEVKSMKKPKKMAMGGMPPPMPVARGGKGSDRGSAGRGGFSGTGRPPQSYVGTAGNLPGGFMGGMGGFSGGPGTYVGPGSGATPGMGAGGPKGQPGMRYPMGPQGGFLGGPGTPMGDQAIQQGPNSLGNPRAEFNPQAVQEMSRAMAASRQGGPGMGAMPRGPGQISGISNAMMGMMGAGPRAPAMKKGGKVSASSYRDMTGGAAGGIGRLEKSSIAAKTKSQKLKAGGKVKGYADGGPMSMDDIIVANQKLNPNFKLDPGYEARARIELENMQSNPEYQAYIARQNAAEKRTRKPKPSKPASGGTASRSASPDDGARSAARRASALEGAMRGRDDRSSSMMPDDGDMVGPMTPYPSGGRRASSGGKRKVTATPIPGGVSFPIEPRSGSRTYNPTKSTSEEKAGNTEVGIKNPEVAARMARQRRQWMYKGLIPSILFPEDEPSREGKKRGGKVKMAKGGKVKSFEGSAADMAQDKKLAKKRGMSLKAWEKSSADEKHDKQQSMKGLKMGGKAKMAMGGYASGGMSTAQDGMKPALRPKPSAMAMGGKVKGMFAGKRVPKEEPTYGDPAQMRREKDSHRYTDLANRKSGSERNPNKSMAARFAELSDMLPKDRKPSTEPYFRHDHRGRDMQDRARSIDVPSRDASAEAISALRYGNESKKGGLFDSPKPYSPPSSPKNQEDPIGRKAKEGAVGDLFRFGPDDVVSQRLVGAHRRNPKDPYGPYIQDPRRKPAKVKVGEPDEAGMKKGGKASSHVKGCKCMACGGMAQMAKGGPVGKTFGKPLPGTKVSSQKIRPTTATGASMKKDGMKGQLRAKASGAKPTNMMKPLGMTKMASGGKVRGAGCAQRGTKFIGEV